MVWTLFLLVRHPEVMEKLRAEIRRDCSDPTQLTRTSLRKMSYLQNVLKETLRVCPSVPMNTRTATKTTIIPIGGGLDLTAPMLVLK